MTAIRRILRAVLTCGSCRATVTTGAVPRTWTCTACGHFNRV